MKLFKIAILAVVVAALLMVGTVFAGQDKVGVCHYDADTGTYSLISIADPAVDAHIAHGDALPGDPVPGMSGYGFANDCSLEWVWANVDGAWTGRSGYVGNLAYPFTMELSQGSDGTVTGTIDYTTGQHGTITGYIDENNFYFTRNDANGYWATCWPCVVSGGTHFHGTGTHSIGGNVGWTADK